MEVSDGMTLEERDRMLAIEAQDKELAKMLQERVSSSEVFETVSIIMIRFHAMPLPKFH